MNYFSQVVEIADKTVIEYESKNQKSIDYWKSSRFYELTRLPPRSKGTFGEEAVKVLLQNYGYTILKPESSKSDFRVSNNELEAAVEIKLSFLWSSSTQQNYRFQQVRTNETDNYDLLLCLGISRDNIKLYPFTKKDYEINNKRYSVEFMNENGILGAQHAQNNCWFAISDSDLAEWHSTGNIEEALKFIDKYFDYTKKNNYFLKKE